MKYLYLIGSLLVLGIKIQLYFLLRTFKGGIIFGIFPAVFGCFRIATKCINDKDISHVYLKAELEKENKEENVKINILGYIFAFAFAVVAVNMQISRELIQINVLHWFLLAIALIIISMWIYVIALFTKYELPIKQYILQSFLCSITGIVETIAIFLAIGIATALGLTVPPLSFFLGAGMVVLPHAWFARNAIARFERVFYKKA